MATTPTTAVSAASFVNGLGVNIHLWETTTGYGNISLVESSLAYLGIENVRDNYLPSSLAGFTALVNAGFHLDLAIPPAVTTAAYVSAVDAFNTAHPGGIIALEGPNEVNIWPVTFNGGTTLADEAAYQKSFYSAIRADSHLNSIPVYDLSIGSGDPTVYQALGNLSSAANYNNLHPYLNDSHAPEWSLNILIPPMSVEAPGLPTVITETGYNTDPNDGYSGVDQITQAKYTLDTLMDAYKSGVVSTYLYELLDDNPDPNNTNPQDHFGLFNSDGSPKLAATAIHDLTTILADPGSTSFAPGSLGYTVTGLTAAYGNQLLLEKSNGTFDLVLWAEPTIYSTSNGGTDIPASTDVTTVNFAQVEGTVNVFDPLVGISPIATYHNVSSVQVGITDHPLVIEVTPGSTPVAGPPAPVVVGFSPDSNIVGDGITDATVLTLTGTAAANSTVTVFDGTKQLGTATANASGAWTYTTGTLASASHSFTAIATDAAGNASAASAALIVTVDAVAPSAPAISSISPDSGVVGDGITNATVLTLTGTAAANSTVTVFDGTKQLGTATANASGAWTYTTGTLASASHSFTAIATDAAGNASAASAALIVTVDAVAPSAPAISSISPDSGVVGDGITNATVLTLTGTAAANSTVTVFDGTKQLGTATANASGAWAYTTGTLASASHSFTAIATDAAGNSSVASSALAATIDTIAPNVPIITSDATVNSNEVLLTGTAEANSTLTVFEGTALLGTVMADANGAWSYTTGPLPGGAHTFTATATDIAGNTSPMSQAIDPLIGTVGLIESFGSTSLVEVGNNFFLNNSAGSGPELKYGAANVVAGQFGAVTPIGAEQTASGYEVAWNFTGTNQYTVWNTDSNGNFISDTIGAVSGTSAALESLENSFHQDLNGDGVIGIPTASVLPTTVIESFGSTSLVEVGNNFFLNNSAGSGPELQFGSAAVTAGQFAGWTPIGAEQTATGYEVAWKITGADIYNVWTLDNTGKYISDIGRVSGTSAALESLENSFHQDLNGDGVIGAPTTVIESFGSTSLVEVGNNYFLDNSAGSGPELQFGSAAVTAGQFAGWTPIGAEQTATGYEVAWKITGADIYNVWTLDSTGKYISDIGRVSGTSAALESLENSFHQDLNGDGVIGAPTTVIESFGSTSLVEVGNNYFLDNSAGSGPELKFGSAAVTAGQFGAWTPIAAEQTATGYEVAWKIPGTDTYTVWTTDSNGKYLSDIGHVSGTSAALESLENSFHQDLNGDGQIGSSTGASTGPVNIITGTAGNNTITSTAVNEVISGNGGNDVFVFGTSFGNDVITDFQASGVNHDVLQFSHNTFSSFAAVLAHAAQVGSDVVITADAADTVTLQNVHLSSLQKNDIHIV